MPLLSQIKPLCLAYNFLLTASMAFGGSGWSNLALLERNRTASYHAPAFIWGSVLPPARTRQSDDSENLHTVQDGERSYGVNSVSLIEAGWHPEQLLFTHVWSTISPKRINNKLLDVHSFGLRFVLNCVERRLQVKVQAPHWTGPHSVMRRVTASRPGSHQESPCPFRHTELHSACLWNKWARWGKKLYLLVPDFTQPGWLLIWDCLSHFNFLLVFSQRDSTHTPYAELSMAKTELLTFKPLQVTPVQKQLLKKGICFKITFFVLKKRSKPLSFKLKKNAFAR